MDTSGHHNFTGKIIPSIFDETFNSRNNSSKWLPSYRTNHAVYAVMSYIHAKGVIFPLRWVCYRYSIDMGVKQQLSARPLALETGRNTAVFINMAVTAAFVLKNLL